MRVKDYHHVAVVVRDLEKCRWFYGEVLGLASLERPDFGFPGHFYQLGEKTQLHLMVLEETFHDTMKHFAIEVEDFQETLEDLAAHDIKIVDGPGKRPDGSDWLFCKDPDGNVLEIVKH